MQLYMIGKELIFPKAEKSSEEGLLAVGGDLSLERLSLAYRNGIFPWFSEGDPILWWSPKERSLIYPNTLKISKSMAKLIKKEKFTVTFDKDFENVIKMCSFTRKESGTWITDDMKNAYINLFKEGIAHSVEVWYESKLVGGLYGVSIGKGFFGESMFSIMDNTSKIALISLANYLFTNKYGKL